MMKKFLFKSGFMMLLFVLSYDMTAQVTYSTNRKDVANQHSWQVGALVGIGQYYGDISNRNFFEKISDESRFAGSLYGRRIFSGKIGVGLRLDYGSYYSEKDRNTHNEEINRGFSSNIFEIGPHLYLNFSNIFFGVRERIVNVYGTAGISFVSWDTEITNSLTGDVLITNDNLNTLEKSYNTKGAAIPFTLGLAFRVSSLIQLNLEQKLNLVLSDDVDFWDDGFSSDVLTMTQVGITFNFGHKAKKTKKISEGTIRICSPTPVGAASTSERPKPKTVTYSTPTTPTTIISGQVEPSNVAGLEFRVQVLALSKPTKNITAFFKSRIHFDYPIVENHYNGLYRYSTGSFRTIAEAEVHAQKMRQQGIHDAFVVAYRDNQRVAITPEMK